MNFEMGPSVKFVLPNKGLISKKIGSPFVGNLIEPGGVENQTAFATLLVTLLNSRVDGIH